jgi:D-glycero-D-manno-heptose 1,7-bisphosphate phosphatase
MPRYQTIFLDRDGVINRRLPDDYVKCWAEFEFLPSVVEALGMLRTAGIFTAVITNQRGIARGLFTRADLADIHARMQQELARHHAQIDAIYACPDLESPRRKPRPGMLLEAFRDHPHIRPETSLVIGDSATDIEAGHLAGVQGVLVSDPGDDDEFNELRATKVPLLGRAISLADAVHRYVL